MSYDLPVRRSQQIGSAFTVATLPTLSQMVGEPIGMLAYTVDGGLYAWNGTTWVAVAAGAALALGITPITGGTSGYVLYDNAGVVGELANTGTGNNVLATSPTLVTPVLGAASGTSLALSLATGLTLNGSVLAKTNTLLFIPLSYFISPTSTATTISITGASGDGTTATLTFGAITTKIPVGTVIAVAGMTPSGYNTTYAVVTASSTTSVSYANTTTGFTSGGTIAGGGNTYTPSAGAVMIRVSGTGAGGGGGGGALTASGTASSGGAGGGGAGCFDAQFRVSDLAASLTITTGTGGTSGAASSTSSTAGSTGGQGTNTLVTSSAINICIGQGGGAGAGGQSASNSGGGAGGNSVIVGSANSGTGSAGGTSSGLNGAPGGFSSIVFNANWFGGGSGAYGANGAAGSSPGQSYNGTQGGGSGGGVSTTPAAFSGGGLNPTIAQAGMTQPFGGSAGNAGGNANMTRITFGFGGAGGGSNITGTAGAGGAGAYGGGGGGGGSNLNTFTAGNGGKGGDGFVSIVEYF